MDGTATPLSIVAEYDRATVHPNGCGGVESTGRMYINSGGGTAANPMEADLYFFPLRSFSSAPNPPNTPAPSLVFSNDGRPAADSHGAVLAFQRYLWVGDRAANTITIVDTLCDEWVGEISIAFQAGSSDPAPDLMGISPAQNRIYVSLRGPSPLTGNVPGINNAAGSTPGLGVIRVERNGRVGELQAIAPIQHVVNGVERADPHGLAVRVVR